MLSSTLRNMPNLSQLETNLETLALQEGLSFLGVLRVLDTSVDRCNVNIFSCLKDECVAVRSRVHTVGSTDVRHISGVLQYIFCFNLVLHWPRVWVANGRRNFLPPVFAFFMHPFSIDMVENPIYDKGSITFSRRSYYRSS